MMQTIIVLLIIGLIITGILISPIIIKQQRNRLKKRLFLHFGTPLLKIIFRFTPVFLPMNAEGCKDIYKSF